MLLIALLVIAGCLLSYADQAQMSYGKTVDANFVTRPPMEPIKGPVRPKEVKHKQFKNVIILNGKDIIVNRKIAS